MNNSDRKTPIATDNMTINIPMGSTSHFEKRPKKKTTTNHKWSSEKWKKPEKSIIY